MLFLNFSFGDISPANVYYRFIHRATQRLTLPAGRVQNTRGDRENAIHAYNSGRLPPRQRARFVGWRTQPIFYYCECSNMPVLLHRCHDMQRYEKTVCEKNSRLDIVTLLLQVQPTARVTRVGVAYLSDFSPPYPHVGWTHC